MDELLRELLDRLDLIAQTNEEIYDTECREMMSAPISFLFLKPEPNYVMPEDFGLNGDVANRQVKSALKQYVTSASEFASQMKIDSFHARLTAFQNEDVVSRVAKNYFDDYFGWANPQDFDENGDVILNKDD